MYQRRPRHPIRMADDDRRVRPRIGEIAGPNGPLFHAPSTLKGELFPLRRQHPRGGFLTRPNPNGIPPRSPGSVALATHPGLGRISTSLSAA